MILKREDEERYRRLQEVLKGMPRIESNARMPPVIRRLSKRQFPARKGKLGALQVERYGNHARKVNETIFRPLFELCTHNFEVAKLHHGENGWKDCLIDCEWNLKVIQEKMDCSKKQWDDAKVLQVK